MVAKIHEVSGCSFPSSYLAIFEIPADFDMTQRFKRRGKLMVEPRTCIELMSDASKQPRISAPDSKNHVEREVPVNFGTQILLTMGALSRVFWLSSAAFLIAQPASSISVIAIEIFFFPDAIAAPSSTLTVGVTALVNHCTFNFHIVAASPHARRLINDGNRHSGRFLFTFTSPPRGRSKLLVFSRN